MYNHLQIHSQVDAFILTPRIDFPIISLSTGVGSNEKRVMKAVSKKKLSYEKLCKNSEKE
jgi:hypothetical protein